MRGTTDSPPRGSRSPAFTEQIFHDRIHYPLTRNVLSAKTND